MCEEKRLLKKSLCDRFSSASTQLQLSEILRGRMTSLTLSTSLPNSTTSYLSPVTSPISTNKLKNKMAPSPTITGTKPTPIVQHPDQKESSLSQQSVSPTLISQEQGSVESQKKNERGGGTKNASGGDEQVEKGEKVWCDFSLSCRGLDERG